MLSHLRKVKEMHIILTKVKVLYNAVFVAKYSFVVIKKDLVESSARVSFQLMHKFSWNLAPGLIYLDKLSREKFSQHFKKYVQKIGNFLICRKFSRKKILNISNFQKLILQKFLFSFYISFYFNRDTRLSRDGAFAQITHTTPNTTCRLSLSKQRFFSTQRQCCLIFYWIELQMLLRCCLIHISIVILRQLFYYVVSIWSIFHSDLHFHYD